MKIYVSNFFSFIQSYLNLPAFSGCVFFFTTIFIILYPDGLQNQDFSSYTESIPDSNAEIELVPVEGGTFTRENPSPDNPVNRRGSISFLDGQI